MQKRIIGCLAKQLRTAWANRLRSLPGACKRLAKRLRTAWANRLR